MRILLRVTVALLSILTLLSCVDSSGSDNGIYYWRTTLSLSDSEKKFLTKHNIRKMYVRFFDVDDNRYNTVPEATIRFNDSIPSGIEIIPTVYITTSAMASMQLKEEEYAEKILKRINAMCRKNGIKFKEIQLDCDWTKNTHNYFFTLCREMKQRMDSTQLLSSTIRLHQLIQDPPPVDKGVLMVYNTGNLMKLTTENSIFSRKDIEPYMRDNRLANYNLPLDVAYPMYGWSLVYRPYDGKYYFDRIIKRTDLSDYPALK